MGITPTKPTLFKMRQLIILALLLIATLFPLKAQVTDHPLSEKQLAISAEVLLAYPLYFEKTEIGVTTQHLQKGVRAAAYYYMGFEDYVSFIMAVRFTHHFTTIDSATIEGYGRQNYETILLNGSAKTVFNSFIPQFGLNVKSL